MDKADVVYNTHTHTHTHTRILFSHQNKMKNLEIIILSGVNQTEKDKYHMITLICSILKNDTINFFTKKKIPQT